MKIEIKKLSELKPAPYNPRQSNAEQEKQLKSSLEKFGVVEPIIFNKQTGYIVGGHFRIRELKKLGYKEIECVIVDLNEADEKELNIRLNANTGSWDWDELANNWDSELLSDWGLEIPGFEPTILEAEEDDFTAPEGGIETDIVLGDLFEIGEHRLLCGDSTCSDTVAKLMNGEKADMVFTSPPYNANTKFTNVKNEGKLYENYDDNLSSKEYIEFAESVLEICFLNTEGFIFWNVNYNTNSKNEFIKQIYNRIDFLEELICWKKTALPVPSGLTRTWEPIFVFKTNKELKRIGTLNKTEFNFWDINNSGALDKSHRAAFPIKLVEKSLNLVVNAKIILEPFCGSGTTMVASHQLKRKCYGMELDTKYCQVIVDRMKKLDPTLVIKRNGIELK
tara:strand:+ start:679 stop:1857 length:1179 start_codon:yes stop_codon:yes gene_type:complete